MAQIPSEIDRTRNNFGFLRLALAVLVVLSHSPQLIDGNRSREILTRIFGTISFGDLAVDGFFLISGYLITNSWEKSTTSAEYLLKRVLRIYPGFIVAFVFSLFIVGPLSGGDLSTLFGWRGLVQFVRMIWLRGPQLRGAFAGLPLPQLNGSMWTVSYEFQCYVATMIFGTLGIVRRRKVYLGMTLLLLALLALAPDLRVAAPGWIIVITGTLHDNIRFFAAFFCGGVFYLFRDEIRYVSLWALLAAAGLCGALFVDRFATLSVVVLGGYLIFWFGFYSRANILSRIDNNIDLSYGLYLYAWPVQNLLIRYFRTLTPWGLFAASTCVAASLGAISWILVERPFLALKNRIGDRGAQRVPALSV